MSLPSLRSSANSCHSTAAVQLPTMRPHRSPVRLLKRLALLGLGIILAGALAFGGFPSAQPTSAQAVRLEQIADQIYQQMPDLPLENEYVNAQTGRVSTNNTLVSRVIRYHIYAKGRPPNYRLDWKLTLADYLGVNERIEPKTYPSGASLRKNPMEGDITALNRLTLAQRTALVDLLAAGFTPQTAPEPAPQTTPQTTPQPAPQATPAPSRFPRQPQPGDAQLLRP